MNKINLILMLGLSAILLTGCPQDIVVVQKLMCAGELKEVKGASGEPVRCHANESMADCQNRNKGTEDYKKTCGAANDGFQAQPHLQDGGGGAAGAVGQMMDALERALAETGDVVAQPGPPTTGKTASSAVTAGVDTLPSKDKKDDLQFKGNNQNRRPANQPLLQPNFAKLPAAGSSDSSDLNKSSLPGFGSAGRDDKISKQDDANDSNNQAHYYENSKTSNAKGFVSSEDGGKVPFLAGPSLSGSAYDSLVPGGGANGGAEIFSEDYFKRSGALTLFEVVSRRYSKWSKTLER